MMHLGPSKRAHLVKTNRDVATNQLKRAFASGKTAADDVHVIFHVHQGTTGKPDSYP